VSRALAWLLVSLALAPASAADTIVLTNGRVIEADRAWIEGTEVRYQKDGGVYGLPRSLVQKLEQKAPPEPSSDPDVREARARLAAGDTLGATLILKTVVARSPRSVAGLQLLSEASLSLGDAEGARVAAERAVQLDGRRARSRVLLGDALAALGDRVGAETQYRLSLRLHADPDVQRKLAEVAPPPPAAAPGAQFRIVYDGSVNEPIGGAVLQAMTGAYAEFTRRLGGRPDAPVTIVLQTGAGFQDLRVPPWAEGVNDGTIRVPVRGLDRPTPRLLRVLRHELAHSFIAARTGGNCPTWLQEGLSQWLEGDEPAREDAAVATALRAGRLIPLLRLEAPFQALGEADAALAYAESLSAVAHIHRKRGEAGVVRLLSALGDRLPAEEALPVSLALSYEELQRSWEEHLRSLPAR
jgi:hypothetical protein